ncbi:MAG: alpha/beta hydrolase [Myxococcales bacterium]|nr:alpha/beta hydrolase [Myxococcales bacterium]
MSQATPNPLLEMMGGKPPSSALEMREMLDRVGDLLNVDLPEVGAFHEAVAICDGVTADVVVPQGDGPHPVLVYLHGGGWICGSPATHRKLGYRFAEAGFLVLNVDYRMAPEHPFPTPFEDCVAAIRWAHTECARWGGDPARLAVGGDSAGGNLSAAAAAALAGDPACPRAALLIYGVFDFASMGDMPVPEMPQGPELPADAGEKMVELMVGSYLGSEGREERMRDPRVSPLHAAAKLPPSHVVVGSADPLVAQAESLVKALEAEGVAHEHFVDADMPHGYVQMEFLPAARPAIERMVEFLRRTL